MQVREKKQQGRGREGRSSLCNTTIERYWASGEKVEKALGCVLFLSSSRVRVHVCISKFIRSRCARPLVFNSCSGKKL